MKSIQRVIVKDERIVSAIQAVAKDGIISPVDIVQTARSKSSPLHDYFEWDDGVAAQAFRLHQARNLIRVVVQVMEMPDKTEREVRVFVSLPSDRNECGGYRVMAEVLTDDALREELLESALADLRTFRKKYESLKELASVFIVIDELPLLKKK